MASAATGCVYGSRPVVPPSGQNGHLFFVGKARTAFLLWPDLDESSPIWTRLVVLDSFESLWWFFNSFWAGNSEVYLTLVAGDSYWTRHRVLNGSGWKPTHDVYFYADNSRKRTQAQDSRVQAQGQDFNEWSSTKASRSSLARRLERDLHM